MSHNQQHYNDVANTVADKLSYARSAVQQKLQGQHSNQHETELSSASVSDEKAGRVFGDVNRVGLGVMLEYERMGNQPVSSELAQQAEALGVTFEHIGLTLGTVLHNIDICQTLSAQMVAFIRRVLLERKVIFFRDQNFTQDQQVAFARNFGDLDAFPFGQTGDNPYILEILHDDERPGTENGWHTDVTWMERPSLGSVAMCVTVPPIGGDTLFADSHAAYLGMPKQLQEQVQHLDAVHDYRIFIPESGPKALPADLVAQIKAQIPFGVQHPVLRTHPETGKTALYIHGGFIRHESLTDRRTGETLAPNVSRDIVAQLLAQHPRPEYTCRFTWEPGSVAFWDNRAVQHYAASDYYPHERLLRRVTISGDTPFYEAQ